MSFKLLNVATIDVKLKGTNTHLGKRERLTIKMQQFMTIKHKIKNYTRTVPDNCLKPSGISYRLKIFYEKERTTH